MKIQDVLLDGGREEEKAALMQRHQELMKEIKKKSQKKVEAKDTEAKAENKKDAVDKDAINYVESLERIKAASIAARIARGEEIARAQKDFLSTNYPDMLRDANLVKTKIEKFYLRSSSFLAPCFEWKDGNLQKIKSKAYLVKNIDDYNKDGFF